MQNLFSYLLACMMIAQITTPIFHDRTPSESARGTAGYSQRYPKPVRVRLSLREPGSLCVPRAMAPVQWIQSKSLYQAPTKGRNHRVPL